MPQAIHVFTAGSIPVFVSPWYLLLMAWWCSRGDLASSLLFVLAATVSLLVHEFGHALVARRYRLNPRILLHGWGGLCAHEIPTSDSQAIRITAAGPAAGLLLAVVALVALVAARLAGLGDAPNVIGFLFMLVVVNVLWSVLNLMPLYPLDGGQLFRLYLHRWVSRPLVADRVVHGVGVGLGGVGAVGAMMTGQPFLAVILGLLTWQNLRVFIGDASSGPIYRQFRSERALLKQGRALLETDPREASRIGHQVRATVGLPDALDKEAWELIALGSFAQGDWDNALRFARRAERTPAIAQGSVDAFVARGDAKAARKVFDHSAWQKLPLHVRQAQQAAVAALDGRGPDGDASDP